MTEQEKREKVIKELECIRDWSQFAVNKRWLVAGATEKMVKYAEDALELLKAQEPHIVTIADYENNLNVDKDGNLAVWRESRHLNGIAYHNDGWVILNRNRVEGWFNSEMIRFWTSRPTDAQRENTPWDNT